jgi:hypothetical protein
MLKWVMQAHFRHLCLNSFSMIQRTLQSIGFWPLKPLSEGSGVHHDSNSQSGNSLGSVRLYSLTLSYTLESMKWESWATSWPAPFASPCLAREPKVRVVKFTKCVFKFASFVLCSCQYNDIIPTTIVVFLHAQCKENFQNNPCSTQCDFEWHFH